jgi:hypothetical protein
LEKWRVGLKIRNLITLTMIIVGIVLVASGVFAAAYHYPIYFPINHPFLAPIVSTLPVGYVYPYASVGLILSILGLVMVIIGPLLFSYYTTDLILTN